MIVNVTCPHCSKLRPETVKRCPHCNYPMEMLVFCKCGFTSVLRHMIGPKCGEILFNGSPLLMWVFFEAVFTVFGMIFLKSQDSTSAHDRPTIVLIIVLWTIATVWLTIQIIKTERALKIQRKMVKDLQAADDKKDAKRDELAKDSTSGRDDKNGRQT